MRIKKLINNDWEFIKEGQSEKINLPHTWNNIDGQDGGDDYYRGTCVYKKSFNKSEIDWEDKVVYIEFQGANSSVTVFLNNQELAVHHGGYSTFRVDITEYLEEENELLVEVDNGENDFVYPQKADFTFYGGIYRDVHIISVDKNHFDLTYYGGEGLLVTPEVDLEKQEALVKLEAYVLGEEGTEVQFIIPGVGEKKVAIENGKAEAELLIEDVRLWDGVVDPYLYELTAELIAADVVKDTVSTKFGCRTFDFDPQEGFFLNGRSYPLRGVSRHQDWVGVGNALTKEMHETDMKIIAEMGNNTIRLAHYQHDQYFYDLCDEYGMVIWAEIPYISQHLPNGRDNTISQMKELIVQNYNHPSIVTWGLSNEITISGSTEDLVENHRELNDLVHEMDSTRPTTMANLILLPIDDPLLEIPDIQSYNLYYGWYFGELEENDEWFDNFHAQHPDKVIGLSEFGADASVRWQTANPKRGDYTEQYQCVYHEHLLKVIEERPYIWGTHVWNMFDFGSDGRDEGGEKGLNQKGLVTFDRKLKKDAFYLYKAYLSDEPFVHLTGRRYVDRVEDVTEIKVYSNLDKVTLYNNGEKVAEQEGYRVFTFEIPLTGNHLIEVKAGDLSDEMTIRKVAEENEDYILPHTKIHNWFEEPGMEFPEGRLSIRDTIGTIREIEEGNALLQGIMEQALSTRGGAMKEVNIEDAMETMIGGIRLEDLLNQLGDFMTKEVVLHINQSLNKIEKK